MQIKRYFEDYVFAIDRFMSPSECQQLILRSETGGYEEALVGTRQVRAPELRNNDRLLDDNPEFASRLWTRATPFLPPVLFGRIALGFNERLRFYRYDVGQKFDWHFDGPYRRENGEESKLTFMVYLNDDFEGGGTSFTHQMIKPFTVVPVTGTALVFHHRLQHRGDEVTAGRKYVLRTDVMYGEMPGNVTVICG